MNFQRTLEDYKKNIDQVLQKYLEKKIKRLPVFNNAFIRQEYKLIKDFCLSNGKRLRPILTLMAYRAVGGKKEKDIYIPALAFELFHNHTLIHDDIYDEDEIRRNRITNHTIFQKEFEKKYQIFSKSALYKNSATRFGIVAGFINGKLLYSLGILAILESKISKQKKIEGMNLYQMVSIYDNIGQAIDLAFEESLTIKAKDYFDMVLCKTGQLFRSAVEWGVVLGEGTNSQRTALRNYISDLSIAFQIRDDLIDIAVQKGAKGRGLGSDIRKGKKTLLAIHALKKSNFQQKKVILNILGNDQAKDSEIKKVIDLFYRLGSVDYCQKVARQRIKKAIGYLDKAKPKLRTKPKEFLLDLAWFMLERKK
jgi:geranylgeranyl diphosphate synthase type I